MNLDHLKRFVMLFNTIYHLSSDDISILFVDIIIDPSVRGGYYDGVRITICSMEDDLVAHELTHVLQDRMQRFEGC